MLLSAIKTKLELIAERTVSNSLFLAALKEAVDLIEGKDYRLVAWAWSVVPVDGSSISDITAGTPALVHVKHISRVHYVTAEGKIVQLVYKEGCLPPPTSTGGTQKVKYYDLISGTNIQLDSYPDEGELRVRYKQYYAVETLVAGDIATEEIDYDSIVPAMLYWLGSYVWVDQRATSWKKAFEDSIANSLQNLLLQEADMRNLGGQEDE